MALHVVDANEWELSGPSSRLGERMTDKKGSYQPGACGGSNPIEISRVNASLLKGAMGQGSNRFDVGPSGQFGYDAAKPGVQIHLRRHNIGKRLDPPHHRNGGFVTAGFKSEHQWGHCRPSSRWRYSSLPISWAQRMSASSSP